MASNQNELLREARRYNVPGLNATKVFLSSNDLTSIPKFVFSMHGIKILGLTDNNLKSIPNKIGDLRGLENLYLDNNKLTTLPVAIGSLENLTDLEIEGNRITSLPRSIGNLKRLDTMNLNHNRLTTLPETIGNLEGLKRLYLDNNKLTTLPETIGKLKNLKDLMLGDNPLTSVPSSMKNLSSSIKIWYDYKTYSRDEFIKRFTPKRVNNTTEFMNNSFMNARLNNIHPNKRAFVNMNSNVTANGTLRRVYNVNGLRRYMVGRTSGRLLGGAFTSSNIKLLKSVPHVVNKSVYLRNIKNRFANASLNNLAGTIRATKNSLPGNVSRTDVNQLVNGMKGTIRQKISNRLRTTPVNERTRLLTTFRSMGLISNNERLQ